MTVYAARKPLMIKKMDKKKSGLLLVFIFMVAALVSQTPFYANYSQKPDKAYFKSYWTATKKIACGPVHWNTTEWIVAGGVTAVGVSLYMFDDDIRHFFQSNRTNGLDAISGYAVEPWGSGLYTLPFLGGLYIYGLAAKDSKSKQVALGGVQAFVMATLTSQLFKHVLHRHRPYQDKPPNPYLWEGPFKGFEHTAFPSGHTTTAFAVATVIASAYKETIWVPILSYTIATGVGLSRMYDNKHWASDVLIGAALGVAVGKSVFHLMDQKSALSIGISDKGGISLVYQIK